tara:strand:- start:334 stop:462 length:129 start_codon:yes stop_codon:yes gene_type:complete
MEYLLRDIKEAMKGLVVLGLTPVAIENLVKGKLEIVIQETNR